MKKSVKSIQLIRVCLVIALATIAYSGKLMANNSDTTKTHKASMQHLDMSKHDHMKMMGSEKPGKANSAVSVKEESVVRKGVIDVNAIDQNKDGKVYQDQMDWNVISDKPGTCPLCKMTLEQVSIQKAKENLKANGFKVKK